MKSQLWILLLSFSLVFYSSAGAQLEKIEDAEQKLSAPVPSAAPLLNIKDFAVPKTLGKIEDRFTGKSSRWVIHIQDVHAHFAAQENIAALVDHLNAVYGIKTVALEGGWGQTSFPQSWGLPNSKEKQMLARALLEEDYLTGPAYAALFSQSPVMLVGIEDAGLYEENRKIYVKHLAERDPIEAKIAAVQNTIAESKKTTFQPDLLSFDQSLIDFREGKKADKFLPSLIQTAEAKGVGLSDLDQILLFKEVLEKEKALSKEKLDSEAARLMQGFKHTRLSFEELLRSGKIPADKLELYPEATEYLEIMKLQDRISHREFFHQIEEAVERLKQKLFSSEEEKTLDAKSERFLLAKRIILFQATPDDLKTYGSQKTEIDADMSAEGLADALNLALSFYAIAKKRDEIFFQKVTSDERLQGDVAIVTGGFHTEGLSEQMKQAGISYVVVTPDLANEAPNNHLYFQRLQENMISVQTLSDLRNRIFVAAGDPETTVFDITFPQAVRRVEETKNILEGVKMITGAFTQGVAAPVLRQPGAVTMEEFPTLSEDKQVESIEQWLASPTRIAILAMQEDLVNNSYLSAVVGNPANELVVGIRPNEEISNSLIGGKAKILRVPNVDSLVTAMDQPNVLRVLRRVQEGYAAAYAKKGISIEKLRVFPAEIPVALLLLRPLLEGSIAVSEDPDVQDNFYTVVENLIAQNENLQKIVRAA